MIIIERENEERTTKEEFHFSTRIENEYRLPTALRIDFVGYGVFTRKTRRHKYVLTKRFIRHGAGFGVGYDARSSNMGFEEVPLTEELMELARAQMIENVYTFPPSETNHDLEYRRVWNSDFRRKRDPDDPYTIRNVFAHDYKGEADG